MQLIIPARWSSWATILSFCGALLLPGSAVWAQITLPANTVITATTKTYENKDIIIDGTITGTATIDGKHTFNSLLIQNNGVLTHDLQSSTNFAGGMNLVITKNCTINLGSSINVVGKGWAGGNGAVPAGGPGAGVSDTIGGGGGGGSYGGEGLAGTGAAGGGVYDDTTLHGSTLKAPTDIGSGGGSGGKGSRAGGAGGGAIQMSVGGTLQVDGLILADGVTGTSAGGGIDSGGGSGGSIYLAVNTIAGIGRISAGGGGTGLSSANSGGPGGGGRIAIHYTTNNFAAALTSTSTIMAGGGQNGGYGTFYYIGGAGTIFMQKAGQKNGDLWIHNLNAVENGGTPLPNPQTFDNIYVWAQGVLAPPYGGTLDLTVLSNVTVAVSGQISAFARGYQGGTSGQYAGGPGGGGNDTSGGTGGGGSYGGEGMSGTGRSAGGGAPYDDTLLYRPTDLGSGGGSGGQGKTNGGNGGGAIYLSVGGTLQVDGQINAGGQSGTDVGGGIDSGGGSGGSIYLAVNTLTGGGQITATGGNGYGYGSSPGGPGGGGRIAIAYATNNFAKPLTVSGYNISAAGGQTIYYGPDYAGAGTVLLLSTTQKYGDLWVHNQGNAENAGAATALEDTLTFDDVYVWGQGVISAPPVSSAGLTLNVLGTLDVGIGGSLSVAGRGNVGGSTLPAGGPGAGANDTTGNGGGGGSYGGSGDNGNSNINKAGPTYGSATQPASLGSGGGSGDKGGANGGNGGGAIHVIVNNNLIIDGLISADGSSGTYVYGTGNSGSGGGSGGSLWLVTSTLSGAGLISAAGGTANTGGGGGGGGRIAVYAATNNFSSGTIHAPGGSDGGSGGTAGTVYTQTTAGVTLKTLTITPVTIAEGTNAVGTVRISGAAPTGGVTLTLTSSNPAAATVPTTVTVAAKQTSATFTVKTKAIGTADSTTVSATLGGITQSATLNVEPWIVGVTLNPAAVAAGAATVGTVTLSFPAPKGGLPVNLTSSNAGAATTPSSVTVPQGKTSVPFNITTSGSTATETSVTITATYGPETDTATLSIDPSSVGLKAFVLSPTTVVGGNVSIGTVSLTADAPIGGAIVALSSANPAVASIPTYVTIPQGRSSYAFVILTSEVMSSQTINITATLGSTAQPATLTATLTVTPTGVATLTLVPNSLTGGLESSVGIVTLQSAVSTDTTVTISSNNLAAIPDVTSILIPAGSTVGTFTIDTTTNTTGSPISAVITAAANNIGQNATLTIN